MLKLLFSFCLHDYSWLLSIYGVNIIFLSLIIYRKKLLKDVYLNEHKKLF